MNLPEFYIAKGMTRSAIRGRDSLSRIRDALVQFKDQGSLPDFVAVSADTSAGIREFWMYHFPETPMRDLPCSMMGVRFIERDLGGDVAFQFLFRQH